MKHVSPGERLRQLRVSRKLSQKDLAKALFVQHTTISNWEKDVRKINLEQLQQIATYFNVELSYFQHGEPTSPAQRINKPATWIAGVSIASIVLSFAALLLVSRTSPTVPLESCYGQEDCEFIDDPSIVNELTERSITGGIMTNVELNLVYALMDQYVWRANETTNTIPRKQYVEKVLDSMNFDFGVHASALHDAMYQYFLSERVIKTYEYLDFASVNEENKQLIIRNNIKYVMYKTGDDTFSYEVFDPSFVYRYDIDLSLETIYGGDQALVKQVETAIDALLFGAYNRPIEDNAHYWYFENLIASEHSYFVTYREEKANQNPAMVQLFTLNHQTGEVYTFESYFSFQQITLFFSDKSDFFFYPFPPDAPIAFVDLPTLIPQLTMEDLNPQFIEGGYSLAAFQMFFDEEFSMFPFVELNETITVLKEARV